jgi:hypothetical protein
MIERGFDMFLPGEVQYNTQERMIMRYHKTIEPGVPGKENRTAGGPEGGTKDDVCRCKEVSKMEPRQLLRLMISDLAFWKKRKKG